MSRLRCVNPVYLKESDMLVGCGKCLGCRMKNSLIWAKRLEDEIFQGLSNKNAVFLTLTYDNLHLPLCQSICKRHVQLFFKRLRKDINFKPIKYYAVGEYGGQFGRPHYHAIIIGLDISYFQSKSLYFRKSKTGYNFEFKVWGKGICNVQSVNSKSIKYVTGYVMKKLKKDLDRYSELGISPPFSLISKGIGSSYLTNAYKEINKDKEGYYYLSQGRKCPVPRYYKEKLNLESIEIDYNTSTFKRYAYLMNTKNELTPREHRELANLSNRLADRQRALSVLEYENFLQTENFKHTP